jgi:hypothetical protein
MRPDVVDADAKPSRRTADIPHRLPIPGVAKVHVRQIVTMMRPFSSRMAPFGDMAFFP